MENHPVACFLEITAILLTYFIVSDYFWKLSSTNPKRKYEIWMGISQGLIGVLLITKKVTWLECYTQLDTRTVVLCLTGMLWGRVPMLICTSMMAAFTIFHAQTTGDMILQLSYTVPVVMLTEGIRYLMPNWKNHYYTTLAAATFTIQAIQYACIAISPTHSMKDQLLETILPVWVMMPATVLMLGRMIRESIRNGELQQKLRSSEERFNLLSRCSDDLFWELDHTGHIKYISGNPEKILGYTCSELTGTMPHDIITDSESLNTLLRYTNTQEEKIFESKLVFKHKKGYNVYCESRGLKTMDPSGIASGYMGIIHDVTERHLHDKLARSNEKMMREQNAEFRRLYEELKSQNQQINAANAKLSEATEKMRDHQESQVAFVANISQEIMLPVDEILKLSGIATSASSSQEEKNEALAQMKYRCAQMKNISEDLTDLHLIQKGRMRIEISTVNIDELISDLYDHYYYQNMYVDKKPVSLKTTVDLPSDSYLVRTDGARLRQILDTLMKQAFKFTQIGKIWIRCRLEDDEIQFSVADNGAGIPASDFAHIFNPYRPRLSPQQTGMHIEHTAIALNICKNLAELMGGRFWFESELGQGSTFYLTIPYIKPSSGQDIYGSSYSWDRHRILLMGCDKYNNALISSRIAKTGAGFGIILIDDKPDAGNTYQQFANYYSSISLMLIDERVVAHPAAISLLKRYPNAPLIVTDKEPDINALCREMDMKLNATRQ